MNTVLYIPLSMLPSAAILAAANCYNVEIVKSSDDARKDPVKCGREMAHFLLEHSNGIFCDTLYEVMRRYYDN